MKIATPKCGKARCKRLAASRDALRTHVVELANALRYQMQTEKPVDLPAAVTKLLVMALRFDYCPDCIKSMTAVQLEHAHLEKPILP